jgi:Family of unknown function (DUF6510)
MPEQMRLDGNAVAGTLSELFAQDVTAAMATCTGCHTTAPLGALAGYGQGMGVVLRCGRCDTVMLRLVRTPHALHLDATGISVMVVPVS